MNAEEQDPVRAAHAVADRMLCGGARPARAPVLPTEAGLGWVEAAARAGARRNAGAAAARSGLAGARKAAAND